MQQPRHQIVDSLLEGTRSARFIIEAAHHANRLERDFPNVPQEVRDAALQADPSGGGYANWIIDKAVGGVISLPEDADKVRALLDRFHRLKQSPRFTGSKNLYDYKTYGDLARTIGKLETKGRTDRIQQVQGTKEIAQNGALELIRLDTPQASAAVCKDTHWCIKNPKWFDQYKGSGKLFVVLKNGQPYVAIHDSTQAMDTYDDPISPEVAQEIAPLIAKSGIHISKKAFAEDAQMNAQKKQWEMLRDMEARFVKERMSGYQRPDGTYLEPVSQDEAERMFDRRREDFARAIHGVGHRYGFVNVGLINLAHALKGLGYRQPVDPEPPARKRGAYGRQIREV